MRIRLGATVILGVGVVIAVGAVAVPWLLRQSERECAEAIEERRFPEAKEACARAFERKREGRLAASVAMAHLALRDREEAWRWANLPEAKEEVRARRVRGVLLRERGEVEQAQGELEGALERAIAQGEGGEAARAAHQLAGLHWDHGRYSQAYEAIEVSEREAARAEDRPALAMAALAKGDIFRKLGDAQRSDVFYRQALIASEPWPTDHAYALLKVGLAHQDRGMLGLARENLERSLALAKTTGNQTVRMAANISLAEVLASSGDVEVARRHLSAVEIKSDAAWHVTSALIALAEGDANAALQALEQAKNATGRQPERQWKEKTFAARAFLLLGRTEEAAEHFLAAIEEIEKVSALEPQHQGWVVAGRRQPYDALFVLLATRGDHLRAWEVLGRYMLSESLSFSGEHDDEPQRLVEVAQALREQWPLEQAARKEARSFAPDSGAKLLVVHEAEGRLWVGTSRSGSVGFVDAGPSARLDPLIHRLLGDAGDAAAAGELGSLLWETAGLSASPTPLYLAATGRLRRLPYAALRHQGRHWAELRPIARVPSLQSGRDGAVFDQGAVVAGDALGDLDSAREEASWVAVRMGTLPLLGKAATRDTVLSARGLGLLHLATHARIGLDGTRLVLSDGEVSAQEVLRHRPHAKVVVLASCASAVGRDAGGSDSLATAFLRAGSGAVLSTLRTVPDGAAQQMIRAFYEHGGVQAPVVALARAQTQLALTEPASIWSAFVIFVGPSFDGWDQER